jgi:restriction system protein
MTDIDKNVWGIHTLNDSLFLNKNVIAIGWEQMGDLTLLSSDRESFKTKYTEAYPDAKKGSVNTCSAMLYRFCNEMKIGDFVVYPSKIDRMINIGEIIGGYVYDESQDSQLVHHRSVKWLKHIPRLMFSQGALYEVGSALTLFSVKNYASEFLEVLAKGFKTKPDNSDDITVGVTADEIFENTRDYVLKEISRHLKGYDLENFVADLLRTMGYRTIVSPRGGDGGIDITAYKDELPPRILVQVKSQDGDIKETTIQSLKGAMREGDYGLFVTLSNYTKNAQRYLDSVPIIRGINGYELVDLVLKHYNDLDEKYRELIPLKMVYIPAKPKEEEQ